MRRYILLNLKFIIISSQQIQFLSTCPYKVCLGNNFPFFPEVLFFEVRSETGPHFLRHIRLRFQGGNGTLDCLHEKINFDPCNKKLRGMGKFVNARFARFTNSNPKLRRCLSLDWDFSDSFALLTHQKNLAHSFSVFCYRGQKLIFYF